jgi:hypothetical protein
MLKIDDVKYILVENDDILDRRKEVEVAIKDGYWIFSKVSTREAVHYIMVKGSKINEKPKGYPFHGTDAPREEEENE